MTARTAIARKRLRQVLQEQGEGHIRHIRHFVTLPWRLLDALTRHICPRYAYVVHNSASRSPQ